MKLNPRASSSDLEVARAIARRLHQRARGTDAAPEAEPPVVHHPPSAEKRPPRVAPPAPRPAPAPPAEPELQPEPPPLEPEMPELEPDMPELEPEPATPDAGTPELEPEAPELEPMPPGGYTVDTGSFPPSEPEPPGGYSADMESFQPEPPGIPDEPSLEGLGGDAGTSPGVVDDALSELTGPAEQPGLEDLEPPSVSPEDLIAEEPALFEGETAGGRPATTTEDLVEIPAPSWDDVADSCLALASAQGAMLVDPAGQVLAARGDWPEPGPEAIAGRLVSMMEKKLHDAPTRSVSAPLAGRHLTAWRVPADQGYLTVVFMADTPLKADVRPSIDGTIQASAS